MSGVATSRIPAGVAVPPGATTPQLLKQGMYASAACALLVLVAVSSGTRAHREAMQTIGRDTAPSIISAQHVSAAMADMDASAVNELLFSKDNFSATAQQSFDRRRKEASEVLIAAAENITFGDEERIPIRTLATGMSSYTAEIQRAIDLRHVNDAAFLDGYRGAARIMDETLLPAAADLDRANRSVLDRTYSDQRKWSSASMLFLVLSAVALTGVLLALQVFLTRRMRRVINPPLMVATGIAFLSFFFFAESFTRADRALKVAKEDAFESVHYLWKARATAYSANADESRYLLDTSRAAQYEQAFFQKADSVANLPRDPERAGIWIDSLKNGSSVDGFHGLLADELKNITFPGERDAAVKAAGFFAAYRNIDLRMRALEHSGQHAAAIRLCTGESNAVFDKFDQALDETLQINQSAFDEAVKNGFAGLDHLEITASVICGLIALLAVLGLLPRLREYSAA